MPQMLLWSDPRLDYISSNGYAKQSARHGKVNLKANSLQNLEDKGYSLYQGLHRDDTAPTSASNALWGSIGEALRLR